MTITIYVQSNCRACNLLEEWLDKQDIPYVKKNILLNQEYLEEFVTRKVAATPYILIEDQEREYNYLGFTLKARNHLIKKKSYVSHEV